VNAADPFGLVGQVLDGQFRVDEMIGEGGFSAVYRGHHQGLNEPIAIKCLKLPVSLPSSLVDTFVQRFRDESRILYRLSQGNLNVVRSIAAGTTQASATGALVPYMVLEWLEGRTVQSDFTVRRAASATGRSLDDVLKLFATAADGLAYAHAQGVVHRDLNPGNLFLASTHQGVKMKVLDFGVAKLVHDGALNLGPRSHTVGQIKIFAPAYGAPEQFDDRIGAVSAASDVYAFALVLLEALRDRTVVEGTHLGEFAQRTTDPSLRPTPRSLGLDVTDEVEQAFARATTLDPAERWRSAADFWQSLTIAQKFASERKYERAARETPPLEMAVASPATAPLAGPLAASQDSPPLAPKPAGVARKDLARTMPLVASTPGLAPGFPRPSGGVAGAGAPRPSGSRTPTTIGLPAPARGAASAAVPPGAARTLSSPGSDTAGPASATPLAPPVPRRASSRPPGPSRSPSLPSIPPPPAAPRAAAVELPERGESDTDRPPSPQTARFPSATSLGELESRAAVARLERDSASLAAATTTIDDGDGDEATKIHAPPTDVLRTLATHDAKVQASARSAADAAVSAQRSSASFGRAAYAKTAQGLAPPHAASDGPGEDDASLDPADGDGGRAPIPTPAPSSGATLMMAPAANPAAALRAQAQAQAQAYAETEVPSAPGFPPAPVGPGARAPGGLNSTLAMMPARAPGFAPAPFPSPGQSSGTQAAPSSPSLPDPVFGAVSHEPPAQGATPVQGETSQLHGGAMHAPSYGQMSAMNPSAPSPYGPAGSAQFGAPHPPPVQGGGSFGRPPMESQLPPGGGSFGRPPMESQLPPPSFAQPIAAPAKPLPIVPIAIGLAVLALGGIGLGVFALRARTHAANAGSGADSSEVATPTPIPVPMPVDSAAAAPDADAAVEAVPQAEVDAAVAAVEVEDAGVAEAASPEAPATAIATAPPPATTFAPGPFVAAPPVSAKPAVDPNAFSESAARARLSQANGVLAFCTKEGGVTGAGNAMVTFAPDGTVSNVVLNPPYAGTKEGACVTSQFRRAKISAFTGTAQTLRHTFEVPK
jgi:eukaryotic-like serine/threonine-protein kinase